MLIMFEHQYSYDQMHVNYKFTNSFSLVVGFILQIQSDLDGQQNSNERSLR